jgi:CubicO group peptidase (beta-lactamase class C family)
MLGALARADGLVALPRQPEFVPWPTVEWPRGALFDVPASVRRDIDRAVAAPDRDLGETRAVVVVYRGRLVYEAYARGYTPQQRHVSWSMAKSITQALVGAAVLQGLVDIDRPMGSPRWRPDDPRAAITWRQWLTMTDGQRYLEIGAPSPTKSDAARMLFGRTRKDIVGYAARLPLVHKPGEVWNYSTAASVLLADALTRAVAPGEADARKRRAAMSAFMRDNLFFPIGMASAQPEFDAQGTFIGGSLVYATARDFAKFGLLYLRDGVWNARRVLPAGWVDFARAKTPASNSDVYGAGWWISPRAGDGVPIRNFTPASPRDLFSAQGHEGQLIVLVPSKDLIIVRLGYTPGAWDALGAWIDRIVLAFADVSP